MKQESFKARHPLAYRLLAVAGFVSTVAVSALVVPQLVDKLNGHLIKNSATVDIPDEGPEIVRNNSAEER